MKFTIFAVAALVAAVPATANLVTNGSFETGDFTGFTQFDNTGFSGVTTTFTGVNPTDGSFQAFFGPVGSTGGISQDIATVAGKNYTVSFDLYNFGGATTSEAVSFGGTTLESTVNPPASPYSTHTYHVTATGATTTLAFTFRHDPSYFLLDNVSVTPGVPEPAAWALMIAGFGLVGSALRRRAVALAA